jgi:hypothetical protein
MNKSYVIKDEKTGEYLTRASYTNENRIFSYFHNGMNVKHFDSYDMCKLWYDAIVAQQANNISFYYRSHTKPKSNRSGWRDRLFHNKPVKRALIIEKRVTP